MLDDALDSPDDSPPPRRWGRILAFLAVFAAILAGSMVFLRGDSGSHLACNVQEWGSRLGVFGPKPDPAQITVLVAAFSGDPSRLLQQSLLEAFDGMRGLHPVRTCRRLGPSMPVPTEADLHAAAALVREHRVDTLLWGQSQPDGSATIWQSTATEGPATWAPLRLGTRAEAPALHPQLADVLRIMVLSSAKAEDEIERRRLAEALNERLPVVERVLAAQPGELDQTTRRSLALIVANGIAALGEARTDPVQLRRATSVYRRLLSGPLAAAPADLPAVQLGLGQALLALGALEERGGATAEAITALRAALVAFERQGRVTAATQTREALANSLLANGLRSGSPTSIEEAAEVYRAALTPALRQADPARWAELQLRLGTALSEVGDRTRDPVRQEEALAPLRAALEIQTRQTNPMAWAQIQARIGRTLLGIGDVRNDTARLEEAVAAFRLALREMPRDRAPLAWAEAQFDLGKALMVLGQRVPGQTMLFEAEGALNNALLVRRREQVPALWAETREMLARVGLEQAARGGGKTRLMQARADAEAARDQFRQLRNATAAGRAGQLLDRIALDLEL